MGRMLGVFLLLGLTGFAQAEQSLYDCRNKLEHSSLSEDVCSLVVQHKAVDSSPITGLGYANQLTFLSEPQEPEFQRHLKQYFDTQPAPEFEAINSGRQGIIARKIQWLIDGGSGTVNQFSYPIELSPLAVIGVLVLDRYQGVEVYASEEMNEPDRGIPDISFKSLQLDDFWVETTAFFGAAEAEYPHLHMGYSELLGLFPKTELNRNLLIVLNLIFPKRVYIKSVECDFPTGRGEVIIFCPYLKDGMKKRREGRKRRSNKKGQAMHMPTS